MSLAQLSFILGGLLIAVGLLGGGIEIRDLKVPPVGQVARLLSFGGGVAFVALALFVLGPQEKREGPPDDKRQEDTGPKEPPEKTQELETFQRPLYRGLRLDACYEWGKRCGTAPANAWCEAKGFDSAVDFKTENVGSRGVDTKLIGKDTTCSGTYCVAFEYITCERGPRH